MDADQFKTWRKHMKFKQREAADRLGIKKRMVQYYEKGHRDGRPVQIPKPIRLACYAISHGVDDFDGESVEPIERGEPVGPPVPKQTG
jgi:transcriptional regulator with XRE-family HTH domain